MLKLFTVAGGKVEATTGVITGVSVITGGVEAIGHGVYTDEKTLAGVKACADAMLGGVRVKMDHWSGFGSIVGVLKNFRLDLAHENAMGDKIGSCNCLRADLHLLKSHPAFGQIVEMAATIPESFGLSIAFSGKPETIDKLEYARCSELYSIDLVDQPAANPNGLFTSAVDLDKLSNNANAQKNKSMNLLTEITDILAARKTFTAIDEIINPVLSKAKVLQLTVNGQPLALSECPLIARLEAFSGLITQPENKQREAELIASNAIVAREAETAKSSLATAAATVGGLQQEKVKLLSRAETAEAALQTLTAEKAQLSVQLEAAISEFSRVNTKLAGVNSEISRMALSFGCLTDLRGKDNNLLVSTANADEKQAAADNIPAADKLKAIGGAVNGAVGRLGIDVRTLPSQGAQTGASLSVSSIAVLNQYKALTDPSEKTAFYRKNKEAIDAAYREAK